MPNRLRFEGQGTYVCEGPSGTVYRFRGHGAVQAVQEDDVDDLLAREEHRRGCCGGGFDHVIPLFSRAR